MTQTITLQDATITDLKTALAAHDSPAPTPVPTPGTAMTQPFTVTAQNPDIVLVTGPDGPLILFHYDTNTKTPWLAMRSYQLADTEHGVYSGCFIQFQCENNAGTPSSAVTLNAGYVGGVPGKENGDLDIGFPVDGVQHIVSLTGHYTPVGSAQAEPAGVLCWPPDVLQVGSSVNRYAGGGYTVLPVRPGMPPQAIGCIRMGAGYVPVFA
jgi:hypothetical protein